MPELGEDDGREPLRGRAVVGDVARGGRVDAQRVEAVAVQPGLDNGAVARVQVIGHGVQVQLPDDLVGERVAVEVKVDGVTAEGVADGVALVARGRQDILARRQGREVFVELHARPGDEQVGVGVVDGGGGAAHVANHGVPVVVQVRHVPRGAQLVAQRHGDDVGVVLGPVGDVGQAALPVGRVEVVVVEPAAAVVVRAAPLRLAHVHVRVDENALFQCLVGNAGPDLEARRLGRPPGVVGHDVVGHLGSVFVAQRQNHGYFQRDVGAVSLVDIVNHLNGIAPVAVLVSGYVRVSSQFCLHANEVEANALDVVQNIIGRCPFQAFRDHGFAYHKHH